MPHYRTVAEQFKQCILNRYQRPFVLLETKQPDANNYHSFLFDQCEDILILQRNGNLNNFFNCLENYRQRQMWLAGFFSYELGYLLEPKLKKFLPNNLALPLIWLGVFKPPIIINHHRDELSFKSLFSGSYRINNIREKINIEEYYRAVTKVKYYIKEGETYQVNFTFPITFDFDGAPEQLYLDLRQSQPTAYTAFINTGQDTILSLSPELFFSVERGRITTRPMKGTISRGRTGCEDKLNAEALRMSAKERAENVMIVDLLRNDLAKISRPAQVKVDKLFSIERYHSLFQMTSTITAVLNKPASVREIFNALFPCGSVTGAPKISTMQIIRRLEKYPRGVYCGAIGYIAPFDKMCFNVAIRTIHINANQKGILGTGGGIGYDSFKQKEYKEAQLKAYFFIKPRPAISLIESIRFSREEGYYLLDLHLERLKYSSIYFDIPIDIALVKNKLIVLYSKHNGDLEAMSESLTDNTHIVTPSELRLFFKTFELETVIQ